MEVSFWLQSVLDWVQLHPNATGWMIFLVALGESLLLVGILLPGAAILVGLGTLIGLGVVDFQLAWLAASMGAFVGDGISFWIGRHYKERLLKIWPMYKFPKLIEQGQSFFKKWGLLSVFIGRFVGLVRPIIPAIAGMMQMPIKKYIVVSTIAAILWAPFYLLPGMLFGNAMGIMSKVAGKLAILVLFFVGAIALIYWIVHLLYAFLLPRTHRILSHALVWTQKHPYLGKLTSGLIDPRKPEKGSLALMASFIIAITIAALFFSLNSESVAAWSLQVSDFMHAFHTDWTEPVMLFILSVTHDFAIIIPSVLVFLWLMRRKREVAAGHWAFIVITGYILSLLINYFSHENNENWFGYNHLTWFVTVIAFWAALISGALPHKMRSWPYTLATLLIVVVAFAQLFFHQMSLGVVLTSIFSSVLWASVVAIAYRMRTRKQMLGWPISAIFFGFQGLAIVFVLVFFAGQFKQHDVLIKNTITEKQWLNSEQVERKDWLNRPKQAFLVHYLGSLKDLSQELEKQNWTSIEPSAWKDVWKALTTDKNSQEIAIIPSTNNGKIESMMLTKADNQNLIVLHLWQQAITVSQSNKPVYAGYISLHKINQKMGLTYWKNFVDQQALNAFIVSIKSSQRFIIENNNQQYFIRQKELP